LFLKLVSCGGNLDPCFGPESKTNPRTTAAFKFFVQLTFYTAIYCTVAIVALVICLQSKVRSGDGIDGVIVGALAVSALFGLFAMTMTATSMRYVLVNLTTIDYLKSKNMVHQLAIRVPQGTPAGQNYNIITYPLPQSANSTHPYGRTATNEFSSPRDQLATRTYAIVKTEMGENPWDLGYYRNWKSVMGNNPLDWLLPLSGSPCAKYESDESFYEMGPLYPELRARYGLPELAGSVEMRELEGRQKDGLNGSRD
jgi:palmitoyltransferase